MAHTEEQAEELEAIESMFPDQFELLEPRLSFLLHLVPHPGGEQENHVKCCMKVTYTAKYPETPPLIEISEVATKEDLGAIRQLVDETLEGSLGMPMIYTLADIVQEYLREHNKAQLTMHEAMLQREALAAKERKAALASVTGEDMHEDTMAENEVGDDDDQFDDVADVVEAAAVEWKDGPLPEPITIQEGEGLEDSSIHRKMMDSPANIRNMSVVAHVDHGKTTLTDYLVARAGLLNLRTAGKARFTDTRADEQERGITIKSTGVTLFFEYKERRGGCCRPYLINLVDSPGHVDFSSEVTAALRITDGALVVVDCIEGVCVQTETVLRQALKERIKPIAFLNKVDRVMFEKCLNAEEAYQSFRRTIESINVNIATYQDPAVQGLEVSMEAGTVGMGSALQGWAFTLERFAAIYATRFGMSIDKMVELLWGDHFYDPIAKTWTTSPTSAGGAPLVRGFCEFVYEPIRKLCSTVLEGDWNAIESTVLSLGIELQREDRDATAKELVRILMQRWLHAADTLLEMICTHLPSPPAAQRYRMESLYEGPMGDECSRAIRACDPGAPLTMFISKMLPAPDAGRFFAFGRVFSGTVSVGQTIRIQGPRYKPGASIDLVEKKVQRVVLMMGRSVESIPDVPAGNLCALVGLDGHILKTATITTSSSAFNITPMQYNVAPVVQVAVKPKNPAELPKFVDALRRLSKSDPLLECTCSESGEQIIAASGELHLSVALHDLMTEYFKGPVDSGDPIVSYRETVGMATGSRGPCLSKSPNKHNRLYMTAQPLGDEVSAAIDAGEIPLTGDPKSRVKALVQQYGWTKGDAMKIWCFGPEEVGANVLLEKCVSASHLAEIRPHVVSGFEWATKEGPICEEPMRGVRLHLMDAHLHSDAIHRGAGQIMPAARRCIYASVLSSEPRFQEPIYRVDITAPSECISQVYSIMSARRGSVISEELRLGTPLVDMIAHLPVSESFGFVSKLREVTSGRAFPNLSFDHWAMLDGNPLADSKVRNLVKAIREKKGLRPNPPSISEFLDKL